MAPVAHPALADPTPGGRRRPGLRLAAVAAIAGLGLVAAGCGSSGSGTSASRTVDPNRAEVNPAGDIPDDQAFVPYAHGGVTVKVPEGWSRADAGGATTFTDKLNAIRIAVGPSRGPATVATVRRSVLPQLARATPGYRAGTVALVRRKAGDAVRVTYLATAARNPVTGRAGTDAVERYLFVAGGRQLDLTLSGPKGADNVDPWRIVTDSVRWGR